MKILLGAIPIFLVIISILLVISFSSAFATPPCISYSTSESWSSYDDIYTGKIVSISNQTEYVKNNTELNGWQKIADVGINFELEHLLKGNPQTNWNINVPLETDCTGGDFCAFGADHYTIGSEFFYIENYNGNGYQFDGDCGLGAQKVEDGIGQGFINYFEEIYGVPVEKSTHIQGEKTKCKNSEHLLVLRDNNKRACVSEKTAHKLNWNVIENIGIQFQNTTNTEIKYDYPLSSKITQVKNGGSSSYYQFDSEITLSKLPKIGETAILTMTYTNLEENSQPYQEDIVQFYISENFRFVGIDEKDIEYPSYGGDSYYFEEFPSIKQYEENTFSVTIEAISEGYGIIDIGGRGYQHYFMVFVDDVQTLLVEDYYKLHYPIHQTQTFTKQTELIIQTEPIIIPPTQYLPSCSTPFIDAPCTDKTNFEYGYKVLYGNDTAKTKYDYQLSKKFTHDYYSDKPRTSNAVNIIDNYNITITNLPTINETSEITVSLTIADYDLPDHLFPSNPHMFIEISDNLSFVGVPTDEIKYVSGYYKKQFVSPILSHSSLQPNYTENVFATIKALRTGTAEISVYVGDYTSYIENKNERTVNYKMVIGEDETLLMDDYFKKYLS